MPDNCPTCGGSFRQLLRALREQHEQKMSAVPTHALTVLNPWAWAIAQALKDVENRTWKCPSALIGQRVAIHAGLRTDSRDGVAAFLDIMRRHYPGRPILDIYGMPVGGIVAVATVTACVTDHPSPWFAGPYGFILEDVVAVPQVIPCRGALSFWRIPEDTRVALARSLGVVA